jgi:STE24 endopeptidase
MNESRATRYQRRRRRARAAGGVSAGLMLALVALTPVARWLSEAATAFAAGLPPWPHAVVALVVFVSAVVLLWEAAALPALLHLALAVDAAYIPDRGAPTVESVLGTELQAVAVALPSALFGAGVVMLSVQVAGAWWWLLAGAVFALALAMLLHLGPAVLARLAVVRPLSRPDLGRGLAELARSVRVPVLAIDEWVVAEGSSTTAVVTGVGRARRVLLSSELVRHWSDKEIAVVVVHELGHHAHHDLWRTFALNVAILCGGLWLAHLVVSLGRDWLGVTGPGDLAALPLLALVAAGIWAISLPVRHAQSRHHERRADEFALASTGGADAFGAAVRRLGIRHLAEEHPSRLTRWMHHRHPSVAERLELAESYRKRRCPSGRSR